MKLYGQELEQFYAKALNLEACTQDQDKLGSDLIIPELKQKIQVKSYLFPSNYITLTKIHGAIEHLYISKNINSYIPLLIGTGSELNYNRDLIVNELVNNGIYIEESFKTEFISQYGSQFLELFVKECNIINRYYRARTYDLGAIDTRNEILELLDDFYNEYFISHKSSNSYETINLGSDILINKTRILSLLDKSLYYPSIGLWRGFISREQLKFFDNKSYQDIFERTNDIVVQESNPELELLDLISEQFLESCKCKNRSRIIELRNILNFKRV